MQIKKDKLLDWLLDAESVWSSWRNKALELKAYYEGNQWTEKEKRELEELGQPAIVINHIWSKVNSLIGLLLQQEPTIKCLPRGKNDAQVSAVATSIIRYVLDVNAVDTAYTEVFTDMLTTGIGWLDVRTTSLLTYDPILVEYVPFDEVLFDPIAKQPDLRDARFVARLRWIEEDLLVANYPEAERKIKKLKFDAMSSDSNIFGIEHPYDSERNLVLTTEMQYKTYGEKEVLWDGLQAEPYNPVLHQELVATGLYEVRRMRIPVVRKALFIGDELLEDSELPFLFNQFTLVPFIAYKGTSGMPIGIVEIVKDVQDEINKRRSKVLHYLSAKRVLAEEGAIADPRQFIEELRRPDGVLFYRKGFNVQIQDDLQLGSQHYQLMQGGINELSLISGIYPDFVGAPTNARTGAALRTRILQSQNSVQRYFSAMQRGIKGMAERILALAKQFYSTDRIRQIVDMQSEFELPLSIKEGNIDIRNALAQLRADIVVKVGGGGMTERQEQLIQLVELFKSLPPNLTMFSLDLLIDAFDLPQKDEIKKRLQTLMLMQMQAQIQPQGQGQEEGGDGDKNVGGKGNE